MLDFQYNDGGRAAAGRKGIVGDCVVRAIAIAAGIPYEDVYRGIGLTARRWERKGRCKGVSHPRHGVYRQTYQRYLGYLGWRWTLPQPGRAILLAENLPAGRVIVRLAGHLAAVLDGVLHDLDMREPERLYGYWIPPTQAERLRPAETNL